MKFELPIILASQSPGRLRLLQQIHIIPDQILPADIDESERKNELPRDVAQRLAYEKAMTVISKVEEGIIIAADSVAATGRKILPKALTTDDVRYCLKALSGRRHTLYTGLCIVRKAQDGIRISRKVVQTKLKFKRLTQQEIEFYCTTGEGINKAGGYTIAGFAEGFVEYLSGSYSNVIGLPLTETLKVLTSFSSK